MKTAGELQKAIGQKVQLRTAEGLYIDVEVVDVRQVWNRVDCLVTPLMGSGSAWVSVERLSRPATVADVQRNVYSWLNA